MRAKPRPQPARSPTQSEPAPGFDFTPVPTRTARHDGWTVARQHAFLGHLAQTGVVAAAARAVGMSAKSAQLLRKRPGAESFAAAWARALDEGRSRAFDAAMAQGFEGVLVPILYRGRQVGTRRVYDNRVLLAALRVMPHIAQAVPSLDGTRKMPKPGKPK
jgi:hypothetical protein